MISDKGQVRILEQAMALIDGVLKGSGSHENQAVYLNVAGEYCRIVSDAERIEAEIERETKLLEMDEEDDD